MSNTTKHGSYLLGQINRNFQEKNIFLYYYYLLFCYTEPFPNLFSDFDKLSFILYQRKFYK